MKTNYRSSTKRFAAAWLGALAIALTVHQATAQSRIFDLHLKNDTSNSVTFTILPNTAAPHYLFLGSIRFNFDRALFKCYQGTGYYPPYTTVLGPVAPGGQTNMTLARVQGNGCDGDGGYFAIQPSGRQGECQYFVFDNAGHLAVDNIPNRFSGFLSPKSLVDETYTWTMAEVEARLLKPIDEHLTMPRNLIAYDSGQWGLVDVPSTAKQDELQFANQSPNWGSYYESCAGYELFHSQHVKRLPNKNGRAYFMGAQDRAYNGWIYLMETDPGVLDPDTDLIRPSTNGAPIGKIIWQDLYSTINPVGNWNHPGKMSLHGGVLVVAAQNWYTGNCGGSAPGTSDDAVLFYDVRDPEHPRYWGAITMAQLQLGTEISTVSLWRSPTTDEWLLYAGGNGAYKTLKTSLITPNIDNWVELAGDVVTSGQHGDDFITYQWDSARKVTWPANGVERNMRYDADNECAGYGTRDGFEFHGAGFIISTNVDGSPDYYCMHIGGADRDWDADSIYVTRQGVPIVYTLASESGPDGGHGGDSAYLYQVYDTRNSATNHVPHPVNSVVTTLADNGLGSLRRAIGYGGNITFAPNLNGGTINLTNGPLVVYVYDVNINASALPNGLTIMLNGSTNVPVFKVVPGNTLTLSDPRWGTASDVETNAVVTVAYDSGNGSLRAAIANASAGSTITFDTNLSGQTIILSSGQLLLSKNLTIDASALPGGITINANHASRVFMVSSNTTVVLDSLTIINGSDGVSGGGIHSAGDTLVNHCVLAGNSSGGTGGGIYGAGGTLAVNQSTLTNNSAHDGGGIYTEVGVQLTVSGSALRANLASYGGGILSKGNTLVDNCTLATNATVPQDPAAGGGIYAVTGTLTVNNSFLTGNSAHDGGGIKTEAGVQLTVKGSTLTANTAAYGGGIYSRGDTVVDNCILATNSTIMVNPASGGGICVDMGTLTVRNSTLTGNIAYAYGGGIAAINGFVGTLNLASDILTGNSATYGGGISSEGTAVMDHCTFATNTSNWRGGGIFVPSGTVTVNQCTLTANSAVNVGGGISNDGGTLTVNQSTLTANLAVSGSGAGIWNQSDTTVNQSTLTGNSAANNGGGIDSITGTLTVNQSTLTANSAANSGGGIYCQGGTAVTVKQSTLAQNSASYGGGIQNDMTLLLTNCIIARNTASSGGPDIWNSGTITPGGANLIGNNAAVASVFPPGPLVGTAASPLNPLLAPLGNFGGPTQTMPPLPGSPAINAGGPTTFATDQRGFPRVFGPAPDLGAVEYWPDYTVSTTGNAIVVTDLSGNGETLTVSEPSAGNLKFAVAGRAFTVNGGPPATGDSGNLSRSGVTQITVNAGAGNNTINVGALTGTMPSLTINGGPGDDAVNFNGNITFTANANLAVDLQSDDSSGAANLLLDGGFELGLTTGPGTSAARGTYGAWTETANQTYLLGMPYAGLPAFQGVEAIHIGDNYGHGAVSQTFATKIGTAYRVSLAVIGWGGNVGAVRATANGVTIGDFAAPGGNAWGTSAYTFTATTTSTTLQIQNLAGACTIDDVRVTDLSHGADTVVLGVNTHLIASGTGSITFKASRTVDLNAGYLAGNAGLQTVNGDITLEANQQSVQTGGNFFGVNATPASANGVLIQATGTGNIAIKGRGAAGGTDPSGLAGITLVNTTVRVNTGSITMVGVGGDNLSDQNNGVQVHTGALVESTNGGSITITGTGGSGALPRGMGVRVLLGGIVRNTGAGTITLNGTGGTAPLGVINYGVSIDNSALVTSTGSGQITINATAGPNGNPRVPAFFVSGGANRVGFDGVNTYSGNIIINADSMGIANALIQTTATTTLRQKTTGTLINLGGADVLTGSPLTLGLTDAELDQVTAGTVQIGGANSGAITVSAVISPLNYKTLAFGNNVNFAATGGFSADVGPTAAVYEKMTVSGTATLTPGATLAVASTGGYVPAAGDTFILLANDSTGAITGNFNGLPEGALVSVGGVNKKITYVCGTGNDVALFTSPSPYSLAGVTRLGNGSVQFRFSNASGLPFTVLAATNVALPFSNWTVLGAPTESPAGQYQFTDPQATNMVQRFYRVRSP